MQPLVEVALINAVMVTLLALPVAVAGWWFRRPALTHVLWLLVLVKLVTPPLWRVPLLEPDWLSRPLAKFGAIIESGLNDPPPLVPSHADLVSDAPEATAIPRARPRVLPATQSGVSWWPRSRMRLTLMWLRSERGQGIAAMVLLLTWGLGTVVWFTVQAWRCLLFQNAMRRGRPAPADMQHQLAGLAVRSGARQPPQVWLMPGVLSPMLWSIGCSTRLIFPEALFQRMPPESRETLLAHELAHFQRGDHWVRFVSLLATGLYWWHPVVWWARHMIEASEEECCDAWVVTRGSAPPRRYAEAILETVDFLAERRCPVPPLGTGLGQLPFLRQRLIWIMRGSRRQDFSQVGRICCAVLAIGLPIQPTWLSARPITSPAGQTPSDVRFEGGSVLESHQPGVSTGDPLAASDTASAWPNSRTWHDHAGEVAVKSLGGRFVAYIGSARQLLVDQTFERVLDLSPHRIRAATFTPDGQSLITGDSMVSSGCGMPRHLPSKVCGRGLTARFTHWRFLPI